MFEQTWVSGVVHYLVSQKLTVFQTAANQLSEVVHRLGDGMAEPRFDQQK